MWSHLIPGAPEIRRKSLLYVAFACFYGLSLSVLSLSKSPWRVQAGGPAQGEQFVFAFLKLKALPLIYSLTHSLLASKL